MPQIPISRLEKLLLDLSIRIKMPFSGGNILGQIRVPLTQQNSNYILFYPLSRLGASEREELSGKMAELAYILINFKHRLSSIKMLFHSTTSLCVDNTHWIWSYSIVSLVTHIWCCGSQCLFFCCFSEHFVLCVDCFLTKLAKNNKFVS